MSGRSRWENPRDGDPTASPHRHSSSHIPPSQKCPRAAAHRAPQTALLFPWKRFPRIEGSYYSSWEILLQSPGWASGYSKGGESLGK